MRGNRGRYTVDIFYGYFIGDFLVAGRSDDKSRGMISRIADYALMRVLSIRSTRSPTERSPLVGSRPKHASGGGVELWMAEQAASL